MDFYKSLCFAKLYTAVIYGQGTAVLSPDELDIACEVLKKMTDDRQDWTKAQKETYKAMVDFAKEQSKHSRGE